MKNKYNSIKNELCRKEVRYLYIISIATQLCLSEQGEPVFMNNELTNSGVSVNLVFKKINTLNSGHTPFTTDEIEDALEVYYSCSSASKIITEVGQLYYVKLDNDYSFAT